MIEIIPVTEEHIVGFHRALDSVAREKKHLANAEAPPIGAVRKSVLRGMFDEVPRFVAVESGTVVGWCDIAIRTGTVFAHCGTLGMGVISAYRRRGIGFRLLTHALQKAEELGLERLELQVYESNLPAISLYEKFGFQREGVKVKAAILNGHYEDCVLMALPILRGMSG